MELTEFIFLFVLGLVGSFIGALVGGGGLITLPMMMLFGIPAHFGIGANKCSFAFSCCFNVIQILREKRVPVKLLLSGTLIGLVGGLTGGFITANISEQVLNYIIIILLAFALVITLVKKPVQEKEESDLAAKSSVLEKILTFLVAVYDGGFGPGSTTLGIMMFMHRGYPYVESVHLTRMLIMGSAVGALFVFWTSGFISWYYVVPLTMGSIFGAQMGFKMLTKISQKTARALLMGITILLIIQVGLKIVQ